MPVMRGFVTAMKTIGSRVRALLGLRKHKVGSGRYVIFTDNPKIPFDLYKDEIAHATYDPLATEGPKKAIRLNEDMILLYTEERPGVLVPCALLARERAAHLDLYLKYYGKGWRPCGYYIDEHDGTGD